MSILTAEEYSIFAGRTVAPSAQIEVLCESAGAVVEAYLSRSLEKATRTEFYSGTGTKFIALRVRPVISITSVYYDPRGYWGDVSGSFDTNSTLFTQGVDYALHRGAGLNGTGLLLRIPGVWPEYPTRRDTYKLAQDLVPSYGDVKVTYVAGFDPIPADIKLAVARVVSLALVSIKYGGSIEQEKLGDWSYQFMTGSLAGIPDLGEVRQILSQYRELPW